LKLFPNFGDFQVVIHVQELCKSFQQKPILTDLNFHLDAGDRLALLGPNGSGKTLLIKIIATLIKPTSGSIEIAGYDAIKAVRAVRPLIGYVPQTFEGYPTLSTQEYLEFFAAAYRLEKGQRATGIQDVLELMDLATLRDEKIEHLSLGQKQRLCLAKTFLHDPLVWLFDAPISLLDPQGQVEVGALIQELGTMGKTVILATNSLSDVITPCNRVGILSEGRLVFYGEMHDISERYGVRHRLEIEVSSGMEAAQAILDERSEVISLQITDALIQIESQMTEVEATNLLTDLIRGDVTVSRFQKIEYGLADLFLEVTSSAASDEETS
jgi:ABC-2 type transport system ATP-binding protein